MKFEFTEGNYDGAFKFGGALTITAQGAQEVESLIKHFRLFNDVSNVTVLQARIPEDLARALSPELFRYLES